MEMDDSNTVTVPLLFARSGEGIMKMLSVALIPEGGGVHDSSIKGPLEELDRNERPLNKTLMSILIPEHQRLDHFSSNYCHKMKSMDGLISGKQNGYSHLLMASMAFYALSADNCVGGEEFRLRLYGWTASGYPDKKGKLKGVSLIREKIGAIFSGNKYLEPSWCQPVSHLILSDINREDLLLLDSVSIKLGLLPEETITVPIKKIPVGHDAVAIEVQIPDDSRPFRLLVHFARNFDAVLELVFGSELLKRYRRIIRPRRLKRVALLASAVALLILTMIIGFMLKWRQLKIPYAVTQSSKSSISALNKNHSILWSKNFPYTIRRCELLDRSDGSGKMILVGLSQEHVENKNDSGIRPGDLIALDRRGNELWRFSYEKTCPYAAMRNTVIGIDVIIVTDLLPNNGNEILIMSNSNWFPSRVCILNEKGELLRDMWHPGNLSGVIWVESVKRLILWGCNNDLWETKLDNGSKKLFYGVFCVDPDKLNGQAPPYKSRGYPRMNAVWYKIILPQGYSIIGEPRTDISMGPKHAFLELRTEEGWFIFLDREGRVIDKIHGDTFDKPEPTFIDLVGANRSVEAYSRADMPD